MTPPAPITGSPMNAADAVAELVERRGELGRVVVGDDEHVLDERAEALPVGGDPAERGAVRVHAVVARTRRETITCRSGCPSRLQ